MADSGPTLPLPHGACDSHLHIFGDPARYRLHHPNPLYEIAPHWTLDALNTLHRSFGFDCYIAVQPTAYAKDHSLLIDHLEQVPLSRARGVAIIDNETDDGTLMRMHKAGVRGARFNFQPRFGLVPTMAEFHRCVDRIRPLGWFIKIFIMDELADVEAEVRKAKITTIVDHLGPKQDFSLGIKDPNFQLMCDIIRGEGWWIMLSNGHRRSASGPPFDDMVEFGSALYEAAPERSIWGTDWPHVTETRKVDEEVNLALLRRYLPDEDAFARVLVKNPAKLFDFAE